MNAGELVPSGTGTYELEPRETVNLENLYPGELLTWKIYTQGNS